MRKKLTDKKHKRTTLLVLAATTLLSLPAAAQTTDTTSRTRNVRIITLNEVQISTSRGTQTTPLATSIVNKKQIADNKTDASLPYIIELEPSIVASGENGKMGNTSLRLRGIDATRINVNINGIPLNDAESQMVYWVNIPNLSGMAQNIQIQRGVTASTGGSASFGGALNLQTLTGGTEPYATADISLGSWNTRQYGISAGSGILPGGFSIDMAYNGLMSDGYVRNGYCDHQSLFLSASHYTDRSLLKAIVIIGTQHTGITWDGASAEELDADPTFNGTGSYYDNFGNVFYYNNESDNYNQRHYQLYYTFTPTPHWMFNAAVDFTHGDGYYEEYKDDKKPSKYGLTGGSVAKSDFIVRKQMLNGALTGSLSAKYSKNRIELSFGETFLYYDGKHFGNVIWAQDTQLLTDNAFSNDGTYEWYRNQGQKRDATSFARLNYNLTDNLNAYADMQYRYVNYTINGPDDDFTSMNFNEDYNFFNPKVGLNYQFQNEAQTKDQRLYLVGGIAHREPTRADIKDILKPENLADTICAEKMLDIEAGYKISGTLFSASANLYAMLYKDQLTASGRLSSSGYALMENVDNSYRLGIELEAGWKLAKCFNLEGNLTLSQNKIVDYQYHYYDANYNPATLNLGTTNLSYSPSVVSALVATYQPLSHQKWSGLKLQAIGKYVGEMYCDNTSRAENLQPDYFLLNLKGSYTWHLQHNKSIELQLVVNNILNQHYRLSAWTSDEFHADGSYTVYRGFYQQPGINYAVRMVVNM